MQRSILTGALAFAAVTRVAQGQADHVWEVRSIAGAALPIGAHHAVFASAPLVGGELALRLTNEVDVVGLFSWQPSQSKYTADSRRADVWVYNVGLERAFHREQSTRAALVPFAGVGVGGRAYDFASPALASGACFAPYASGGAAYEWRRSTIRAEARESPVLQGAHPAI